MLNQNLGGYNFLTSDIKKISMELKDQSSDFYKFQSDITLTQNHCIIE